MARFPLVLSLVLWLLLASLPVFAADPDLSWRQFRHDPAHTNFAPGTGRLNPPAVKWRMPLGGQVTSLRPMDVDLDGADDLVSIEVGRVTARNTSGKILWASSQLAATWLAAEGDVDGDGSLEILAISSQRVHLIRSHDGATLWSSPVVVPRIGFASLADFDGDGVLDVAYGIDHAPGTAGAPQTMLHGFVPTPHAIATTAVSPNADDQPLITGQATVDVDGDGVMDLLLPGFKHFYAFSGKTGQQIGVSPELPSIGPPPQAVGSFRPDPNAAPIVLYAAEVAPLSYQWHGVAALQLEGNTLKLRWSSLMTAPTGQHYGAVRGSIADLDNDGAGEIVAARFDAGAWTLEARDAVTGTLLHTLTAGQMPGAGAGGPLLAGIVRLTPGARATLVVQRVQGELAPPSGTLSLWQWSRKDGFVQFADIGAGAVSPVNWRYGSGGAVLPGADPVAVALPWGDAKPGQGDLLVARDGDDDGVLEHLEQLHISASGAVVAGNTEPLGLGSSAPAMLLPGPGQAAALVRVWPTGILDVLGANGTLFNDADHNGEGDARFGGAVAAYVSAETTGRLVVSVANKVTQVIAANAGPDKVPTVGWTIATDSLGVRGNLADVNGDGQREVVIRAQDKSRAATLKAVGSDGKPLWTYTHPLSPTTWSQVDGEQFVIADVNGDGCEDFLVQWTVPPTVSTAHYQTVISGKTGEDLWPVDAPCRLGGGALSLDVLAAPMRVVTSVWHSRFSCDAATGAVVLTVADQPTTYGIAALADVNADGKTEVILVGTPDGAAAETSQGFQTLWQANLAGAYHAAAALVLGSAKPQVAQASLSQPTITVLDAATGAVQWSAGYVAGQQVAPADAAATGFASLGLLAVADLTGAGHRSLVFRTTEGYLYCVSAETGAIDWSLNWGGAFGDPMAADVDGDGELELLVTYSDGSLYALDHSDLAPVAWVRENAGAGPALDDAADIDAQESTTTLHANWATVPGADGYAVSLLDQTGATIVLPQSVGNLTGTTLTGLAMKPGHRYTVAVQPYAVAGQDSAFGQLTLSDGVTIVDASVPWIDGQKLVPAAVLTGSTTHILADLHDQTLVRGWQVQVRLAGTTQPVWTHAAQAAQPTVHIDVPWPASVAPGKYVVRIEATDAAGHSAAVELNLDVCAAPPWSETACFAPAIGGEDAGSGGGDVSSVPQVADAGCGCRIAATGRQVPSAGGVLFLAACLWLIRRARTAQAN